MSWMGKIGVAAMGAWREVRALSEREAGYLMSEAAQFRGLLPLLTRNRDNREWSPVERAELNNHLRRMTNMSPYLIVALLPGSFLLLPLLAWWRDRRRNRVPAAAVACAPETPV